MKRKWSCSKSDASNATATTDNTIGFTTKIEPNSHPSNIFISISIIWMLGLTHVLTSPLFPPLTGLLTLLSNPHQIVNTNTSYSVTMGVTTITFQYHAHALPLLAPLPSSFTPKNYMFMSATGIPQTTQPTLLMVMPRIFPNVSANPYMPLQKSYHPCTTHYTFTHITVY